MSTVAERVQAGYQWLVDNRPDSVGDINPRTVRVSSTYMCPLGQSGGYWSALDMDHSDWLVPGRTLNDWAVAHGFNVESGSWEDIVQGYAELTEEWRKVLA